MTCKLVWPEIRTASMWNDKLLRRCRGGRIICVVNYKYMSQDQQSNSRISVPVTCSSCFHKADGSASEWPLWHKPHCKESRSAPFISPTDLQNPEVWRQNNLGVFRRKTFFIMRIPSPLIKHGKISKKRGGVGITEQNYFCKTACCKSIQADAHGNTLPNYFTIVL